MALYEVYEEIKALMLEGIRNMNWRRAFVKLVIAIVIIISCVGGCSYFNKFMGLKDDNVVEEAAEDVIEHETGIHLDLTPLTPEVMS